MPNKVPQPVHDYLAMIGSRGGKIGGKSRSKVKRTASKKNGKSGGRPVGSKNKK
jgi:hypothetical protein